MAKKIHSSAMIGEQGIALIHKIVTDMGFLWHPTGLEAGIDGYIEIRDPGTGVVTNLIIQVQSKATSRDFQAETAQGFEYVCDARDLDYWLCGNAPVILIRSRLSTDEAYWVSIKDYFKDLSTREARKIYFDKQKNRFDINCREALIELAKPKDAGIYLSPLPKSETLYSNLVEVVSFAEHIYIASTDFRYYGDIWKKFDELGVHVGKEWILKHKQIRSFHDLSEYPWTEVCDPGSVERFDTAEWAYSDDPDVQREFVQLLNHCLGGKMRPDVWYSKKKDYYFFAPTEDLSDRKWFYQSMVQKTDRDVFRAYYKKGDPSQVAYYRHSAFKGQFVRFNDAWYLEITPTYHYTRDGYRWSWYSEEHLKGIKRLERNPAVFGQVVMWADVVRGRQDLFTEPYPFLSFESLLKFDIKAGLDDNVWLGHEERKETKVALSPENQLSLF